MPSTNDTRGDKLTVAQRHAEVIRLRKAGMSYDAIAKATGYGNKGTVFTIVKKHLTQIREGMAEDREDLRALEVERLDHLQRGLWVKATQGDTDATRTILRIMQRRSAMLGLDVPVEFEMRLSIEQVDFLEATMRRVLDAVHTALVQLQVPAVDDALADVWPTIMGEVVPGELVAAAHAADPSAVAAAS